MNVKNDDAKLRGEDFTENALTPHPAPPQPNPPEAAAHAQRRQPRPVGGGGGGKMAAALLARLCWGSPGLRGPFGLRATRPPLAAAAAPPLLLRRPAAPPGPRCFSAAELVRAAPAALQPYLRLMRLHQPAGERGGEDRGRCPRGLTFPAEPPAGFVSRRDMAAVPAVYLEHRAGGRARLPAGLAHAVPVRRGSRAHARGRLHHQ